VFDLRIIAFIGIRKSHLSFSLDLFLAANYGDRYSVFGTWRKVRIYGSPKLFYYPLVWTSVATSVCRPINALNIYSWSKQDFIEIKKSLYFKFSQK